MGAGIGATSLGAGRRLLPPRPARSAESTESTMLGGREKSRAEARFASLLARRPHARPYIL